LMPFSINIPKGLLDKMRKSGKEDEYLGQGESTTKR